MTTVDLPSKLRRRTALAPLSMEILERVDCTIWSTIMTGSNSVRRVEVIPRAARSAGVGAVGKSVIRSYRLECWRDSRRFPIYVRSDPLNWIGGTTSK
jgi:hypothetical protein